MPPPRKKRGIKGGKRGERGGGGVKKRDREKEANYDKTAESTNPGVIMTERSLSSRIIDKLLIISPGEGCLFATYSG